MNKQQLEEQALEEQAKEDARRLSPVLRGEFDALARKVETIETIMHLLNEKLDLKKQNES